MKPFREVKGKSVWVHQLKTGRIRTSPHENISYAPRCYRPTPGALPRKKGRSGFGTGTVFSFRRTCLCLFPISSRRDGSVPRLSPLITQVCTLIYEVIKKILGHKIHNTNIFCKCLLFFLTKCCILYMHKM